MRTLLGGSWALLSCESELHLCRFERHMLQPSMVVFVNHCQTGHTLRSGCAADGAGGSQLLKTCACLGWMSAACARAC